MPEQNVPPAPVEHADPQLGVLVELDPGVVHAGEHLRRQRVLRLGPVHRHDEDVAAALGQQVGLGHRRNVQSELERVLKPRVGLEPRWT